MQGRCQQLVELFTTTEGKKDLEGCEATPANAGVERSEAPTTNAVKSYVRTTGPPTKTSTTMHLVEGYCKDVRRLGAWLK